MAVGAGSALLGAGLGTALALITRVRRPLAIYFWLTTAAMTMTPLMNGWPTGDVFNLTLWRGAPDILGNYFDFLRGASYLLAMPYPFAKIGLHAPDPDSGAGSRDPVDPHGAKGALPCSLACAEGFSSREQAGPENTDAAP